MMNLKVVKVFYASCFILSLGVTLSLLVAWWRRNSLPYNESGRYHDGVVVWHEQAVGVYAVLIVASIFMNIVIAVLCRKFYR